VQKSWAPDTIDAQGLMWSPDGRWLVVWEAPGHGHKVLLYTPDGNAFKAWGGPKGGSAQETDDIALGPGVKLMRFSADSRYLAIGDSSRRICIFETTALCETIKLHHPTTIVPQDTLQV
jgi:hypothetical protein